jgi:hypothetical protein
VAAEVITNGILQNALKQHRQLFDRSRAIFLRQPHHGVLHDIQCGMIVMHGKGRLFERAPFNLDQKIRKFAFSGQFAIP